MKVSAKTSTHPAVSIDYPLLDVQSLGEMAEVFGEEVVMNKAKSAIVIDLQSFIRRMLDAGSTEEEIQRAASEWKPNGKIAVRGKSVKKAANFLRKLSPEERRKLLAELQEMEAA